MSCVCVTDDLFLFLQNFHYYTIQFFLIFHFHVYNKILKYFVKIYCSKVDREIRNDLKLVLCL